MTEKFKKAELLGATRRILTEIADWTESLFDSGAGERLIGTSTRTGSKSDKDWNVTGSAGSVIERSIVVGHIGRVIDCLNTNVWHGDPSSLNATYAELTPFHGVLESNSALMSAVDDAIDQATASSVLQVLDIFFARVKLESHHEVLELPELAVIAGLAEKTVRMAAIGQDRNPDLVTFKDGSRTFVKPEEASRWLATKNVDYRPINWSEEQFLPPVDPKDMDELGPYLRILREKLNESPADLGLRLGWSETTIEAYIAVEEGRAHNNLVLFTFELLVQLAQALCPAESSDLLRILDRVIHPRLLEMKIAQQMPSSTGNQ